MGGGSSSTQKAIRPPGLNQLNESLFELHSPNGIPEVEIIFFHGLEIVGDFQEAFWKTWVATDNEQVVWPKDWLPKKFPNAKIMSVSYDSSARKTKNVMQGDMELVGETLVDDIIFSAGCGQGHCPVFLVGHCLGGIVIKQFISSAIEMKSSNVEGSQDFIKINTFLDNFKGAFFYATPHNGSPTITNFATGLPDKSPILGLLKTLDKETGRINQTFALQRAIWNARTYAVAESCPTKTQWFDDIIVPEASARHDVDQYYTYGNADHFTVCKARNENDFTVIDKFTTFVNNTLQDQTVTHSKRATEAPLTVQNHDDLV